MKLIFGKIMENLIEMCIFQLFFDSPSNGKDPMSSPTWLCTNNESSRDDFG